jgi:hypothetical protein
MESWFSIASSLVFGLRSYSVPSWPVLPWSRRVCICCDSAAVAPRVVPRSKGRIIVSWLTTTDHKTLGYMYLITSFAFFCRSAAAPARWPGR